MSIDRFNRERGIEELFEHAPCGLLATRPDGTIVDVNTTFAAQVGATRERLLSGVRFAELLTLAGQIYHDTHFHPLLQMQGSVAQVAFDLARPGREPLPVLVNATTRPSAGTAAGPLTLLTVLDATDRRTYERELLHARRLADEATVAERAAKDLAESASRSKDEFLALVTHELRTPLNAILGWTQMLQQAGDLNGDLREGLGVIERNATAQAELINDLLDVSRMITGKMRLNVRPVTLAEAVEAAMDTARPAADAKGVRLGKVLDPGVAVSGDPNRLQQVFWNLLINAVKFTPSGGSVRVVMQRVNSHVEVSVIDSGQGMTPEFIAHAFERFRQSDSDQTQKSTGLGLGLSIVKNLVEMHGGTIRAASEGLGKGSTFVVELPVTVVHAWDDEPRVHPRAAVEANASAAAAAPSLKGVRVLVVDDDFDARDVVRRVLSRSGADVTTAGSADEALQLLEGASIDVLVSDIGMPGEDGYALIRKVRMLGAGAGNVKAIALTAFARIEDRTQAMLAGFQLHLTKPVDARELVAAVASLASTGT
jgi:signal transduction histidine kinase/CheY-like chemotaxis protein